MDWRHSFYPSLLAKGLFKNCCKTIQVFADSFDVVSRPNGGRRILLYCFVFLSFGFPAFAKDGSPKSVHQDQPEIRFEKTKIKVGDRDLLVELALTSDQQERGLMYRQALQPGTGMLFVFAEEGPRSFWMKNTFIDLAIGYFDEQKKLIDIQEMKAVRSVMESRPPSYPSRGNAKYALEVPAGWFARHKVRIGTKLVYGK